MGYNGLMDERDKLFKTIRILLIIGASVIGLVFLLTFCAAFLA